MKIVETPLRGLYEVEAEPRRDERGWFARVFCAREWKNKGLELSFVQMNHSFNERAGTFRGFHFQSPPYAETKLIRCISGRVLDFAIDLRAGSPTFLQSHQVELSAQNQKQILIPAGFAHGFLTLEDRSELLYHHTEYYQPEAEKGLRWDDPQLRLASKFQPLILSDRDRGFPLLPPDFKGMNIA